MAYVQQTRSYIPEGIAGVPGLFAGVPKSTDPVPAAYYIGGYIRRYVSGSLVSTRAVYVPGNLYGGTQVIGGLLGQQTTYSWRTGRLLEEAIPGANDPLSGKDIMRAIYTGYDVNLDGNPDLGDLEDRNLSSQTLGRALNSYDTGHNFWTTTEYFKNNYAVIAKKNRLTFRSTRTVSASVFEVLDYDGPIPVLQYSGQNYLPLVPPNEASRLATGTKHVLSAAPNRPEVSLSRFLGELWKDGLPNLMLYALTNQAKRKGSWYFPGFGSEYLNFQFGLVPVVSDLIKLCSIALSSSREIVLQYESAKGWQRRKRSFDPVMVSDSNTAATTQSLFVFQGRYDSPSGSIVNLKPFLDFTSAQGAFTRRSTTSSSFAGAFSYAVPNQDDIIGRFKRYEAKANKLLGTRFTASTLYDITPYSWLLDWFVDFGSVIENAELLNDGLVMKYGYVMHFGESYRHILIQGVRTSDGIQLPVFVARDDIKGYKYRDRATPFGFGVDFGALTPYQWSILSALGLSRAKGPRLNE